VYEDEGGYVPVARVDGAGPLQKIRYYHNDLNGLPEQLTETDGHNVWQATYRVWGNTLQEVREPYYIEEQNLRFQGQYLDRETGLHFNTFRFYDPDVGRFTTPDPIGLDGELNLYQYAPNPLVWIDPWGWKTCGAANGNSRLNNKVNHVYVIRNKTTGEIYKYGISGGKITKSGKSYRAQSQVRRLNRQGPDKYESAVIKQNVTRSKALKIEMGRVNGYSVAIQRAGQTPSFPKMGINPPGNTLPNATR
jgi:RHS repeat-associated protein